MSDLMQATQATQAMQAYGQQRMEQKLQAARDSLNGSKIHGGGFDVRAAKKTAQDFEAFFLSQALQPMFENIEPAEPFGGGPANDVWKSMQVDEYGKAIARRGGIGIADMVLKQMIEMQEAAQMAEQMSMEQRR